MTIERAEKFRFLDQSHGDHRSFSRIFFVRWKILPDGLEKSRARAASFPCSKFYCRFYMRKLVDRDEQLPVGHVSRLFRASPPFFLFILSIFFLRRTRLSSSWFLSLRTSVCLVARACYTEDQKRGRETQLEGFLKGQRAALPDSSFRCSFRDSPTWGFKF